MTRLCNGSFGKNLSVIIPCFNAEQTLATQLEALARQSLEGSWEVIIADNGSTDKSLSIAESYCDRIPTLKIVDASAIPGAAFARNEGARAAVGDVLVFCDSDDEVAEGWLSAISEAMATKDFVASRFEFAKLNPPWVTCIRGGCQESGIQRYHNPPYLDHSGGCGIAITRALHEAIGGFDESFSVLEDTDYCFRAQLHGVKMEFVPGAVVHVRCHDRLLKTVIQAFRWAQGNVFLYSRYRFIGMPLYDLKASLGEWKVLLRKCLRVRNQIDLVRCLWGISWRAGRLWGCFRFRVFAP